jgi:hypothetical protein
MARCDEAKACLVDEREMKACVSSTKSANNKTASILQ